MKTSKIFTLDWRDLGKGLLMAVLGAIFGIVLPSLQAGSFEFDWKKIGASALVAALTYLSKNFLTNSKDEFAKGE